MAARFAAKTGGMVPAVSETPQTFMKKSIIFSLLLLGGLATAGITARAQDSGALLDLMVRKGLITDAEAEQVRSDLTKDFVANTPAGKLNLSSNLTELRISGDLRMRFETRSGQVPSGDNSERDRFRYRLRAGLSGRLANDWSWGFRVEGSDGSRSSNVTMGDENAGPFTKTKDAVYIGQVWARWNPNSAFNLTVGRMPNPLTTTSMVWDGDINPEGIAEQFNVRRGQLEYSATLAQFVYNPANTQNFFGTSSSMKDQLLLAWQGGLKYYIDGSSRFLQVSPTLYTYVRGNATSGTAGSVFNGNFTTAKQTGINDLQVVEIPMEYAWQAKGVPMRLFGDAAVNLQSSDRARKFGRPDLDGEKYAWNVGIQYGKAAAKGTWDAKLFYQSTGAFALDPNLVDSDLFDSRTNMKGVVFSANYALGTATQLTFTAARAQRVNDSIAALGSGDIATGLFDRYTLLQVDLNLKF